MTLEELQKEAGSRDCVLVKRGEWEDIKRKAEHASLREAQYNALRPEAKGGA